MLDSSTVQSLYVHGPHCTPPLYSPCTYMVHTVLHHCTVSTLYIVYRPCGPHCTLCTDLIHGPHCTLPLYRDSYIKLQMSIRMMWKHGLSSWYPGAVRNKCTCVRACVCVCVCVCLCFVCVCVCVCVYTCVYLYMCVYMCPISLFQARHLSPGDSVVMFNAAFVQQRLAYQLLRADSSRLSDVLGAVKSLELAQRSVS